MLSSTPATAYETDQYRGRGVVLTDSLEILDGQVNSVLQDIARQWEGEPDNQRFAREVYKRLGGLYWVARFERWALRHPDVERYKPDRDESIYAGFPIWSSRISAIVGISQTFLVNDVRVGGDKFGHFFSQGYSYFDHRHDGWSQHRVLGRGAFWEKWFWGYLTTGIFSNGDLVANYEGQLFYESLFEPDVVPGKSEIIVWRDKKPFLKRRFTWADHINDYWDEALHPSYFVKSMRPRMLRAISLLCDDYRSDDHLYVRDEPALIEKYADLGLKPSPEFRPIEVCREAFDGKAFDREALEWEPID